MNTKEKEIKDLSDERYTFIVKQENSYNGEDYTYNPGEIDVLGEKIFDLIRLNRNELSFEFIMEELSKLGDAPNLLYDDNGHWAVTCDGWQNVVADEPEDVETHFYVEAHLWKDTPREALKVYFTE